MKYEWKIGDKLEVIDSRGSSRLVNGRVVTAANDVSTDDKKVIPIEKHLVLQDSCGNFICIKDSEKEAIEYAKSYNKENLTVYKLVEVAKISTERKVVRVKPKKWKK